MKDLPQFQPRHIEHVESFIRRALVGPGESETAVEMVIAYDDSHYRVIFRPDYFTIHEDRTEPSRSQWNTLKKHLKRIDPKVFIFKDYGSIGCDGQPGNECYYLDFGFFAD